MLVHDLKHNKNEFADSPHNADDLLALLEAMRESNADSLIQFPIAVNADVNLIPPNPVSNTL